MPFSRNHINRIRVLRKVKRNVTLSQNAVCISLRETHDSMKKLNTLS